MSEEIITQESQEEEAILPEEPAEAETEAAPTEAVTAPAEAASSPARSQRDYAAEVASLYAARPELRGTELPAEVVAACVRGTSLTQAYTDFARRQREETRLRQREARVPRRPAVKSVTQGGAAAAQGEDAFLRGFNTGW